MKKNKKPHKCKTLIRQKKRIFNKAPIDGLVNGEEVCYTNLTAVIPSIRVSIECSSTLWLQGPVCFTEP